MSNRELELKAFSTRDFREQKLLSNHVSSSIRRNLALNKNLNYKIANYLLEDCVVNVSYVASKNPNTTKKRNFSDYEINHRCISCTIVDIHYKKCASC